MLSRDSSRRELDVLKKISRKNVLHEGIVELLDDFVVISSQMVQYHCLVLEAMWQNAWYFCKGFQLEYRPLLTRHISCQVLGGLKSLQSLGIIHNGRTRYDITAYIRSSSFELCHWLQTYQHNCQSTY